MESQLSPQTLAKKKYESSGLTMAEAKAFGIQVLGPKRVAQLSASFHATASLKINYFTPSGAPTKFYRVRYLGQVNGFDGLLAKAPRYVQPPKTPVEIYWTRGAGWARLADDPSAPIYLTEGELKACCATKHGFPCIAIGGVWSWRSALRGEAIAPSLTPAGFIWAERIVYIVFDNDVDVNPNVATARLALCNALTALGARPSIVSLPSIDDVGKTGLDDFIVKHGKQAFSDVLMGAQPFAASRALWQLNSETVYVRDPGIVVVLEDGRRMAANAFISHAYANRHFINKVTKPDGSSKLIKTPLAKYWLEWEWRSELARMTYAPGRERVLEESGEYNLWRGWGCCPKRGDVTPWHELLDFLFASDKAARSWFERWCAYPLQHPGAKLYSAAVVWGVVHGTGKSLIGYSLGKIYGDNFTEIGEEHLSAPFNEWAESKQFVLGDDIASGERRGRNSVIIEKLKNLITQQKVRINAKFVPSFTVPDCLNYYFTGNQPDLVFLEDTDRRYFVHEVNTGPKPRAFYQDYDKWLASPNGPPALFDHLLRLPLGDFDAKGAAPWTLAKQVMAHDNKSDLGAWVAQLRSAPEQVLRVGEAPLAGDLFTSSELLALYDPERKGRVTSNGLGRELKRAGFRYVNSGAVLRTNSGLLRLYAIRNCDTWREVPPAKAVAHYHARFGVAPSKQKKY